MQIDLSDKDLKQLLSIINLAVGTVGYAHDFLDSPQISTRARVWGNIEADILKQAYAQGLTEHVDYDEHGYHIAEYLFEKNMEITDEYDDLILHQDLARNLARRDLFEHYTEAEILALSEKSGGYLGVIMHPFEEKYWQEFEDHDYTRLRIVENKSDSATETD